MTTGESPMAGRSANPRAGPGGRPGRRIPHGTKNDTTPARDNGRPCAGHLPAGAVPFHSYLSIQVFVHPPSRIDPDANRIFQARCAVDTP